MVSIKDAEEGWKDSYEEDCDGKAETEYSSLVLSLHPGASENKDISVDDDANREETLGNVDKIAKWWRHETDWGTLCFTQNYAEQDDAVAETEDAVSSDQLVNEGKISLLKYSSENRDVDEKNECNGNEGEHFFRGQNFV